jgi:hypothetical protein
VVASSYSIIEEVIKTVAKAVWMWKGVINEQAAARSKKAGLIVVIDKCMLKERHNLR